MGYELTHPLTGEAVPELKPGLTFEQWVDYGRALFAAETRIGWQIADWWAFGADAAHGYGERAKMAAEGIFRRTFKAMVNAGVVSRVFPETTRQHGVSFTHHQEIAPLARNHPEEAADLLQRVAAEKIPASRVRGEVIKIRTRLGDFQPREDDDPEYTELMDIARRWNRARPSVRQQFLDLANEANLGVIDP